MEDKETSRREDGKQRRPRRTIIKDRQDDGNYEYHQSASGESQTNFVHAREGKDNKRSFANNDKRTYNNNYNRGENKGDDDAANYNHNDAAGDSRDFSANDGANSNYGVKNSYHRDSNRGERSGSGYGRGSNRGGRGGYNRDSNRDDRGGYNRDSNQGGRGGYNRDSNQGGRGGYNRDSNQGERSGYNRDSNQGGRGGYNRDDRGGYRGGSNQGERGTYGRNSNRDGGYNRGGSDGNDTRSHNGGYGRYNRSGYNSDNTGNENGGYNHGGYRGRKDADGQGHQDGSRGRDYGSHGGNNHYSKDRWSNTPHKRKEIVIPETARPNPANVGLTRLNKFLSNSGVCSRREADKYIAAGAVSVNGEVVTTMGFMVKPTDVVTYGGETLQRERKRYFLLNKPKGYITTADDPEGRHTVMELVSGATKERIFPVGRLDRNTTGLLLFTNDGDLSKKLTHPSTGVYKIYHVELDKPLSAADMKQMREGMELEDGPIKVDDIQYVGEGEDKRIVGVAIHSGRNRIVRRIFESCGYEIYKLDRVVFAGLTKKDLPRGRYRELSEKEVSFLKMI